MEIPTQPPEAKLIDDLRQSIRPKLSVRRAALTAGISEGRWRQIIKGYNQATKDTALPAVAPADTLARMARTVGATAEQLREVGRDDAAEELDAMLKKSAHFREVKRQVGEIYDAMQHQPDSASVRAEGRIRSASRLLDSAIEALGARDHSRAIEDLDTSTVVVRSAITAIQDISEQKENTRADQSTAATDDGAQQDAQEEGDEGKKTIESPDDAESGPAADDLDTITDEIIGELDVNSVDDDRQQLGRPGGGAV